MAIDLEKLEQELDKILKNETKDSLMEHFNFNRNEVDNTSVKHELKQIEDLYRAFNPKGNDITYSEESSLRWLKNKLPVDFTKWVLENKLEDYYSGLKTIKQLFREFKNEKLNK